MRIPDSGSVSQGQVPSPDSLAPSPSPPGDPPCLTAALAYAARGWRVLAVHWPTPSGRCSCGRRDCDSPAKHPLTRHGVTDATTDPAIIRAWWHKWPGANVAIAGGGADDLAILDGDSPEALARLAAIGPLPPTAPMARTARGGHAYVRLPGARNGAGILPGVDLRGEGGYAIAAPSRHVSGAVYAWEVPPAGDVPEAPAWLVALVGHSAPADASPRVPEGRGDYLARHPHLLGAVVDALTAAGRVPRRARWRRHADGTATLTIRCPSGTHEDTHPSAWVTDGGLWGCASCNAHRAGAGAGGLAALARLVGVDPEAFYRRADGDPPPEDPARPRPALAGMDAWHERATAAAGVNTRTRATRRRAVEALERIADLQSARGGTVEASTRMVAHYGSMTHETARRALADLAGAGVVSRVARGGASAGVHVDPRTGEVLAVRGTVWRLVGVVAEAPDKIPTDSQCVKDASLGAAGDKAVCGVAVPGRHDSGTTAGGGASEDALSIRRHFSWALRPGGDAERMLRPTGARIVRAMLADDREALTVADVAALVGIAASTARDYLAGGLSGAVALAGAGGRGRGRAARWRLDLTALSSAIAAAEALALEALAREAWAHATTLYVAWVRSALALVARVADDPRVRALRTLGAKLWRAKRILAERATAPPRAGPSPAAVGV